MKKPIISLILGLLSINSFGFEIFALGTSNTNCKGAGQAYTNALNDMFAQEKINAQVINAGVDGDRPVFMMPRLEQGLKSYPNTNMEEELRKSPGAGSSSNMAGCFNFHYTNILGELVCCPIHADKSMENFIMMFPAKLNHSVSPFYTSNEFRISVSGNFVVDARD